MRVFGMLEGLQQSNEALPTLAAYDDGHGGRQGTFARGGSVARENGSGGGGGGGLLRFVRPIWVVPRRAFTNLRAWRHTMLLLFTGVGLAMFSNCLMWLLLVASDGWVRWEPVRVGAMHQPVATVDSLGSIETLAVVEAWAAKGAPAFRNATGAALQWAIAYGTSSTSAPVADIGGGDGRGEELANGMAAAALAALRRDGWVLGAWVNLVPHYMFTLYFFLLALSVLLTSAIVSTTLRLRTRDVLPVTVLMLVVLVVADGIAWGTNVHDSSMLALAVPMVLFPVHAFLVSYVGLRAAVARERRRIKREADRAAKRYGQRRVAKNVADNEAEKGHATTDAATVDEVNAKRRADNTHQQQQEAAVASGSVVRKRSAAVAPAPGAPNRAVALVSGAVDNLNLNPSAGRRGHGTRRRWGVLPTALKLWVLLLVSMGVFTVYASFVVPFFSSLAVDSDDDATLLLSLIAFRALVHPAVLTFMEVTVFWALSGITRGFDCFFFLFAVNCVLGFLAKFAVFNQASGGQIMLVAVVGGVV